MIELVFFARLREQLGVARESLAWNPQWRTVADVRAALIARGGVWLALNEPRLCCAVNQTMSHAEAAIANGDELAFFPMVTGG